MHHQRHPHPLALPLLVCPHLKFISNVWQRHLRVRPLRNLLAKHNALLHRPRSAPRDPTQRAVGRKRPSKYFAEFMWMILTMKRRQAMNHAQPHCQNAGRLPHVQSEIDSRAWRRFRRMHMRGVSASERVEGRNIKINIPFQ